MFTIFSDVKIKGYRMKKSQFEELTAGLSIVIALLAYNFEVYWLLVIYAPKAIFDTYCAIKYATIELWVSKKVYNHAENETKKI